MLLVAIVGDRGSGKTTLLGLLYAALVRAGSDREDELRFHAAYESLDEITALFQRLMSGAFPDAATKEGVRELRLQLGYARPKRGMLSRLGSKSRPAGASAFRFTLPGRLDEAAEGLREGSTFGTGRWRDALDADVVILLVDSTKLAPKGEDAESRPLAIYDGQIETLFTAIRRWRARGGRRIIHPVFVLSKFDSVAPAAMRAAELEPDPPGVSETGSRAAYAAALLEPNLPRTLDMVRGKTGKQLRFGPPNYVFSWVRTEVKGPGSQAGIRLRRTDGGGWEPDYSKDEYLALLERLAGIAAGTRD